MNYKNIIQCLLQNLLLIKVTEGGAAVVPSQMFTLSVYILCSSVFCLITSPHYPEPKFFNIPYFSLSAMHLFGLNWQLQQTENDTFENGKVNSDVVPTHTVNVPSSDSGKTYIFLYIMFCTIWCLISHFTVLFFLLFFCACIYYNRVPNQRQCISAEYKGHYWMILVMRVHRWINNSIQSILL